MTEAEWLACEDSERILEFLWGTHPNDRSTPERGRGISERQLRLWVATLRDLDPADMVQDHPHVEAWRRGEPGPHDQPGDPQTFARNWAAVRLDFADHPPLALRAALLRDIVGNPWRPVTLPPYCPWRLDWDVQRLACVAWEERRPDGTLDPFRLAVAADALEEAGCADEAILRHLRGEKLHRCPLCRLDDPKHCIACQDRRFFWCPTRQPHVRGCHALEAILGEERPCPTS